MCEQTQREKVKSPTQAKSGLEWGTRRCARAAI